jgi:sugar lactone lactonase YvrE
MACPDGCVTVEGERLTIDGIVPEVRLGDDIVRVEFASPRKLRIRVPATSTGGSLPLRIGRGTGRAVLLEVGRTIATGVNQVDSPVFDSQGRLYVTYSGARGQQVPVSIFRIGPGGARESFSSAVANPTSMALSPDGVLYVSNRFDGTVYRVAEDGSASVFATHLGIPCGLAWSEDALFVGDRSGNIFRVRPDGQAFMIAPLPPSAAAFHLAMGKDGALYVTAPTLTTRDRVYRVQLDGPIDVLSADFGRPQGLAFDSRGRLFVTDALAGASGLFLVPHDGPRSIAVSGEGLIGVAFTPGGGFVLASNECVYAFAGEPGLIAAASAAR